MEQINNIKNKIIKYLKDNIKLIIFILCFAVICLICNINSQFMNYILKRGTLVEYSIPENANINTENIHNKLKELQINYSFVDKEIPKEDRFDKDGILIKNSLYIAIPYILNNTNKHYVDDLSDYVFNNYKGSKLIDIATLNEIYSEEYTSLIRFIGILFISLFLWILILYVIFDCKKVNEDINAYFCSLFDNTKKNINKICKKTKEEGPLFLLKFLLFDEKEDEKETNYTKEIVNTIIFVLIAVIIIRYFIGELRWIPSGSMRPTILEKDRVFVEKLEFPHKEIRRGDILVFYPPETTLSNSPFAILARLSGIFCKDIAFIKRTIGLPGDKFEIKYNDKSNEYRVYINDIALDEPYISSKTQWTPCGTQMFCGPFIIPENKYFMMGDNRDNSQDSRFWGFLDGNRVIGRANFMFWPMQRINKLNDKYFELNKEIIDNKTIKYNYILDRY